MGSLRVAVLELRYSAPDSTASLSRVLHESRRFIAMASDNKTSDAALFLLFFSSGAVVAVVSLAKRRDLD